MTRRLLPWPGLSIGEVFLALGHDMWRSRPTADEVLSAGGAGHPGASDLTDDGAARWDDQLGRIRRMDVYRAAVLAAALAVYVCLPVALIGLGVTAYARPVGLWFLRVAGFVALCATWVVAICGLVSRYRAGLGALATPYEHPCAGPSLSFGSMYVHDVVHPVSVLRLPPSPHDLHQPAHVRPRSVPLYGQHRPALVRTPVTDEVPVADEVPPDQVPVTTFYRPALAPLQKVLVVLLVLAALSVTAAVTSPFAPVWVAIGLMAGYPTLFRFSYVLTLDGGQLRWRTLFVSRAIPISDIVDLHPAPIRVGVEIIRWSNGRSLWVPVRAGVRPEGDFRAFVDSLLTARPDLPVLLPEKWAG
jgi:hypothetical protein